MLMGAYNRTIDKVDFPVYLSDCIGAASGNPPPNPCFSPPIEPTGMSDDCHSVLLEYHAKGTRTMQPEDAIHNATVLCCWLSCPSFCGGWLFQFFHCSSVKSPLPPSS